MCVCVWGGQIKTLTEDGGQRKLLECFSHNKKMTEDEIAGNQHKSFKATEKTTESFCL